MKVRHFSRLLSILGVGCGYLLATGQSALADINYGIDSFNDGYYHLQNGNLIVGNSSSFEFYGLAIIEDGDNIVVALNANLPKDGVKDSRADDGMISWGDFFFNFSGDDFNTASAKGSLYSIHFAGNSNSNASTVGLYKNVTATSVYSSNFGFKSLDYYNTKVQDIGGNPSLAQLPANTSYFNQTAPVQNVINTGDFVTGINMLSASQLSGLGFDFGQFGAKGTETFGFSFNKNALPVGNFIASIFAECVNDGMVIVGQTDPTPEPVPEPLSILGSLAGIGLILRRQKSKRNQAS